MRNWLALAFAGSLFRTVSTAGVVVAVAALVTVSLAPWPDAAAQPG